jgi:hypothetical protein
MFFAIQNFVSAYYQYDLFENKYPEINKMLWKERNLQTYPQLEIRCFFC